MYTVFPDLVKYCESVSHKQCGHPQCTFLLCLNKLRATGESLTVTNKMALRPKYSRLCSSQTYTPSFTGCCGPDISPKIIIYFCLLHNQGGRFKIVSTIGHVLCVLLFKKGFMPSVLIAILIFHRSMANSRFHESIFHHCVASTGCHHNNSDSLSTNQCFK
jgi:hypothetical protein